MRRLLILFVLPVIYLFATGFYFLLHQFPQFKFLALVYLPFSHMHLPGLLVLGPIAPIKDVFLVNFAYYAVLNIILGVLVLWYLKRTKRIK